MLLLSGPLRNLTLIFVPCSQAEAGADPLVKMRSEVDRLLEALAAIETEVSQLQNERVGPPVQVACSAGGVPVP